MDALSLAFLGWGFLASLFLVTTFFIRKHFVIVVLLNLVFNTVGYISVSQFLGIPKPMDYSIPFYNHNVWDSGGVHLFGFYHDNDYIYLLVDEGTPRLYRVPYDDDFISELKAAIQAADGDIRRVKIIGGQGFYGNANTASHFHVQNYTPKPFDPKKSNPNYDTYETK